MSYWIYLAILGLLLILTLTIIVYKRRQAQKIKNNAVPKQQTFHGVTVLPCPGACDEVKKLCGKKFLANQAPILPVPGCTVKQCLCTYHHYDDRRDGKERRHEFIQMETTSSEKERRYKLHTDRRHDS